MHNPFSLEGKTILVTGASSGIGRATAIECSKMGAKVIVTGRNSARLQETFDNLEGDGHQQIIADLTIPEEINNLIKSIGTINGLALCAGIGFTLPVQFCTREKFDSVFGINFFSPVELLRLLYKGKKISKGGSVVVISSIGGVLSFTIGNSVYEASKAALNAMMESCALEFSPRLIRVNSICPGMVETPLIHGGSITEEELETDRQSYPLKRYGRPEDIAYAAIYLLSDASSWVTGTSIAIDGGKTI